MQNTFIFSAVLFYALTVLLWVLGVVGWVLNIVALVVAFVHDAPVTAMFIGRIVGVFAFPIGAVLGWF